MMELLYNDFAHAPEESGSPWLWDRQKLAYAPCLGAIGVTPFDHSLARFNGAAMTTSGWSWVMSPIGPALYFDGSLNRVVQWTAASWGLPVKCGGGGAEVTIEFYVRLDYVDNAARYSLIFRSDVPGVADTLFYGYRVDVNQKTGALRLFVQDGTTSGGPPVAKEVKYESSVNLTPDVWNHVVVIFNPALAVTSVGQMCLMLINGALDYPAVTLTATAVEIDLAHSTSKNGRIGGLYEGNNPKFAIALLRVWQRSLIAFDDAGVALPWEADGLYLDPLGQFRRPDVVVGKSLGRTTRNTRQTMNCAPGVGFMRMRRGG